MTARRRGIRLVLGVLALWIVPSVAKAHDIHTTMTVVSQTSDGLTFTVRSFADDFSLSVARHAGRAAPRDSSVRGDEVTRYVQSMFVVRDASGQPLTLRSCGVERRGAMYFSCFRVVAPHGLEGVRIVNRMLTETHTDQVNIVQVEHRGARRTLLFTRASAPSALTS